MTLFRTPGRSTIDGPTPDGSHSALANFLARNPPNLLLGAGEKISWLSSLSRILTAAGLDKEADRAESLIAQLVSGQIDAVDPSRGAS